MTVITDENDIVRAVGLLPLGRIPSDWHCWFPVSETIPPVGEKFIPNFEKQPWLLEEEFDDSERFTNDDDRE